MARTIISQKNVIWRNLLKAAGSLNKGRIVIIPTETVYGLAADPFNRKAVMKMFRLKKKPPGSPVQILIADFKTTRLLYKRIPKKAKDLMERCWPGPVTIVMEKKKGVPDYLTAGKDTVGVRMPDHLHTLELIKRAGGMIAATSANISGKKPPKTAQEAKSHFKTGIDFVLDTGPAKMGRASRVVEIRGSKVTVLRT